MAERFYNWNSANIATWNKARFPNNTGEKQRAKLAGEMIEFKQAVGREHKLEELADVFIASAGLTRFGGHDKIIGAFICFILNAQDDKGLLKYAVNKKMLKNIEREFDEQMHHI
jgi:hypothetical protein